MKKGSPAPKPEAEILASARRKLVDHVPEFLDKLIEIARRPGRNAQTQLAAIKDGMNRAGLIELRTAQITSETSDGQSVTLNVNFLPPKKEDE
jgi:hypothetical protein